MTIKYMGTRLCAALLTLAAVAGSAQAQGQPQRQTPQPGDVPAADKVFGWFEGERIFVQVEVANTQQQPGQFDTIGGGTFRHGERFGNRVGNLIPFRVRVYLIAPKAGEREVQVDFPSLKEAPPRFTLQPVENQDWWVANREVLQKGETPIVVREFPNAQLDWGGTVYNCSRLIEINVVAQTFKDPRFRMNFWLEFAYAVSELPGGGLDWKSLETPDFWIDLSRTADPGNDLSLGNTKVVPPARPAALAWSLIGGGSFIGLAVLTFWSTRYLRRNFGGLRSLDDQERLWFSLIKLTITRRVQVDSGKEAYAFTTADLIRILDAINAYINATEEGTVDVSAWTTEEFKQRTMSIKDGERWLHIVEPLRVVATGAQEALTPERYGRIVAMIRDICPIP